MAALWQMAFLVDGVDGVMNYYLNIKNKTNVKWRLVIPERLDRNIQKIGVP